jgi:hypothetical protein
MAAVEFDSGGHSLLAIQFPEQPIHQLIKCRRQTFIAIFQKLVALSRSGGLLLFCSQLGIVVFNPFTGFVGWINVGRSFHPQGGNRPYLALNIAAAHLGL